MVSFSILQDNQGRLFLHVDATDSTYIVEVDQGELTQLEQAMRQPPTPLDRDSDNNDSDNGDKLNNTNH